MANVWSTIKDAGQWVVLTALDILESKRAVSQFFDTSYSGEFKLKYPVGNSIQIPYPMQYAIRNGLEYNPPSKAAKYATVSIGEPFGVDLPEIDSLEAALSTPRARSQFEKQIVEPAMTQLAQEIDSRCALYAYQHAAGVVGSLGTNPTTFDATSAAARQYMQELGAPDGDRAMIVPSAVHRAIKGANLALFNPVADVTRMFRKGIVGTSDGYEWYESQSLYRHTAGTQAGVMTVTSAPANGATTLAVSGTNNGDTFKAGDKITIASVLPVHPLTKRTFGTATKTITVLADATVAAGVCTLTVSPALYYTGPFQNINSQPGAGAAITLWPGTVNPSAKVGSVGLALPRNAFALVGIELEEFKDVEICNTKRDPDSGIAIRFSAGSDIRSSKRIRRFDTCIGFGELYNDLAVAVACG